MSGSNYVGAGPAPGNALTIAKLFPIGAIWLTLGNTDPNAQFIGTTWVREALGRVLIGTGTLGTDTYAAGDAGGEARHTLTIPEMPNHNHTLTVGGSLTGSFFASGNPASNPTAPTAFTGGDGAHENRQPYLAVNIWRRTA